jgi:TATA-box binding protein (TBP) (component of TFIID and TFIIIB)
MAHQLKICNIVATFSLFVKEEEENGKNICLKNLSSYFSDVATYNPSKFNGLILKIKQPVTATILIFQTGRCVCTGTKSAEHCELAAEYISKKVKITYENAHVINFRIVNIVGCFNLEQRMDLISEFFKV